MACAYESNEQFDDNSSMTFTLLGSSKDKGNPTDSINAPELDEELKNIKPTEGFYEIQTTEMHDDDMQTRIWEQFVRPSRNSEHDKRSNSGKL